MWAWDKELQAKAWIFDESTDWCIIIQSYHDLEIT
jgi:hypothetical protein